MSERFPDGPVLHMTPDQQLAAAYDTCDDAIIEQTEELVLLRTDLLSIALRDLEAAQTTLHHVSERLLAADAEIAVDPEYRQALLEYNRMSEIVNQLRSTKNK